MAPVNHGGATSLVTAGASPLRNFECGGDRPPSPREVGAYAKVTVEIIGAQFFLTHSVYTNRRY